MVWRIWTINDQFLTKVLYKCVSYIRNYYDEATNRRVYSTT